MTERPEIKTYYGVRCWCTRGERPGGGETSDFEALFGEYVRARPNYRWFVADCGWSIHSTADDFEKVSDEFDAAYEAEPIVEGARVLSAEFMDRYLKHVSDDWNDVFGFSVVPKMRRELVGWNFINVREKDPVWAAQIPVEAACAFFSIDAAYWLMACEDESAVHAVHSAWPHSDLLTLERELRPRWRPV